MAKVIINNDISARRMDPPGGGKVYVIQDPDDRAINLADELVVERVQEGLTCEAVLEPGSKLKNMLSQPTEPRGVSTVIRSEASA